MKKEDYIIYKYQNRSDVIADNVLKTLNEVYSLAYPKIEKPFDEICQDIHKKAEEAGRGNDPNFRIEYKGTSSDGKPRTQSRNPVARCPDAAPSSMGVEASRRRATRPTMA